MVPNWISNLKNFRKLLYKVSEMELHAAFAAAATPFFTFVLLQIAAFAAVLQQTNMGKGVGATVIASCNSISHPP